MDQLSYNGRDYFFERYPTTTDRSLRAFSAADELLLAPTNNLFGEKLTAEELQSIGAFEHGDPVGKGRVLVFHDRFGVLTTCMHEANPAFVASFRSQETALARNLSRNAIEDASVTLHTPLDELPAASGGLLRLPKSLGLLELYLSAFARSASTDAPLLVGFMTRHFTPRILEVADRYAGRVVQSRARKKARLLYLSNWKQATRVPRKLINTYTFAGKNFHQFYGVFSANDVDVATRFLLDRRNDWMIAAPAAPHSFRLMDLGCGNGIIGHFLREAYPKAELTLVDDFRLAIESARLNLPAEHTDFVYEDELSSFTDDGFDLVVTNPPFHLGHENNIDVSLRLFGEVKRILKPEGDLIIVANRHLNYATHLKRLFVVVEIVAESRKFLIYRIRGKKNKTV